MRPPREDMFVLFRGRGYNNTDPDLWKVDALSFSGETMRIRRFGKWGNGKEMLVKRKHVRVISRQEAEAILTFQALGGRA